MPALVAPVSVTAGDRLLENLTQALSLPSPSASDLLTAALSSLEHHARSFGFASRQCDSLIRLAVHGELKQPKTSASLAILRCVVPAPKAKIGREAVLDILSCLGASPGTDVGQEAGIQRPVADERASTLGPERIKADSKVQAAALKLLCVLLDSPAVPLSMSTSLFDQEGQEQRAASYASTPGNLPSNYLTSSARATLSRCYSILFHFIDYQVIRPHLCYLLCRLTKRRNVKHYRIAKLIALRANLSSEPGLSALLSTYANFYPDLLFPELLGGYSGGNSAIGSGSVAGLKYPDMEWLSKLLLAHANAVRRSMGQDVDMDDNNNREGVQGHRGRPVKKAKLSTSEEQSSSISLSVSIAIPNLVTIQPQNANLKAQGINPSLVTELSSLRHLAHSMDRLVLPSQVAAILGSSFGARLMRIAVLAGATVSSEDSLNQIAHRNKRLAESEQDLCWARLSDWLESVLGDELGVKRSSNASTAALKVPTTQASTRRLSGLFRRSRQLFELAEEMPSQIEAILSQIVLSLAQTASGLAAGALITLDTKSQWTQHHDQFMMDILQFVPLIKPQSWASFETAFLSPLETIATSADVSLDTSAAVVSSVSLLLANWGARDWITIGKELDAGQAHRWGITGLDPIADYVTLFSSTASRMDTMASSLIGLQSRRVGLEHSVLMLYEVLFTSLAGLHTLVRVPEIPFHAFSLHASSIMSISRMAGLTQDLRAVFEREGDDLPASKAAPNGHEAKLARARAEFFHDDNSHVLNENVNTLANIIWLARNKPGGFGIDESVVQELMDRGDELDVKFLSLAATSHSRALANLAERFINMYCGEQSTANGNWIRGPVTPRVLKAARARGIPMTWSHSDFKTHWLHWVQLQGATGLYELMRNILASVGNQLRILQESEQPRLLTTRT